MAQAHLQEANSLFVDDRFTEALAAYTKAIELEQNADNYVKRSACYAKLNNHQNALSDANSALKLEPTNAKALLRKGVALFSMEEYEAALSAFKKGQSNDSSNTQFATWIRKCEAELEESNSSSSKTPTPVSSTPAPTPTPAPVATPVPIAPGRIRHEWYQTATHVIVTIFVKGIQKDQLTVNLADKSLDVDIKLTNSNDYNLNVDLCSEIIPNESTTEIMGTKIEIKLKKKTGLKWASLEDQGASHATVPMETTTAPAAPKPKKNWDAIVADEKDIDDAGSDPTSKCFQDIYSNANDEQRRAMMKSYTESGGTVLSMNWDEVGKGYVKGSPPDGMIMNKWENRT
eukprot:TRINITY_DN1892_c0_g1_i1.p1 TRINITY_DN1892_c0_g1~~TRINITY_DN1892_c0_g1_i1.p1  ORF type:complete len:359 (+),score=124.58 TRINITY_DN1892_c0_g1_i1:44-1078(+)